MKHWQVMAALVAVVGLAAGCRSNPGSAISWNQLEASYSERLMAARARQLEAAKDLKQAPLSVWQRTEEAIDQTIKDVLDGKEAELAKKAHPLADKALREWRVEELLMLYHPALSQQLQALDEMAASPNVLTVLLQNLNLTGNGGVQHGLAWSESGLDAAGNPLNLNVRTDTTGNYGGNAATSLSLREFFPDAKTRLRFEGEMMKFYRALTTTHRTVWPVIEDYDGKQPADRADRAKRLKDMVLGAGT